MLQTSLGYPSAEVEVDILFGQARTHPLESLTPCVNSAQVLQLQQQVQEVKVERSVAKYVVALVEASRSYSALSLGASPRGSLSLLRSSRARAYLEGRDYVLPDDVKAMAVSTLAHRLSLNVKSRYAGVSLNEVVEELLRQTPVPA